MNRTVNCFMDKTDFFHTLVWGDASLFTFSELRFELFQENLTRVMSADVPGLLWAPHMYSSLFMLLLGVCLDNGFRTCAVELFKLVAAEKVSSVSARENVWGAQMFAQSLCIQPLMSVYITQTPAHPCALKYIFSFAEVTGVGSWDHAGWLELTLYSCSHK